MKLEELMFFCRFGMIQVFSVKEIRGASSRIGTVVLLKDTGTYKGCAVNFPGMNYSVWFTDDMEGTDKRSRYMKDLRFLQGQFEKDRQNSLNNVSEILASAVKNSVFYKESQ